MTPIELVETGSVTAVLDEATARALNASKFVAATREPGSAGQWRVRARTKVGVATITAPGGRPVTVRVTPKLTIRRLLFLVGYARDSTRTHWPDDEVTLTESDDLVPVTARLYARQLEKTLRQGLLHGYRTVNEASLLVRGRIRLNDQLRRHYGLPLPVETTHDEFTPDITENRILRAACERLLQLPDPLPDDVRRRLLILRRRFADVTPLARREGIPEWRLNRLNARCQPALRLAELVLRGRSVEHQAGDVSVNGFFFDMYQIFEDFLTVALQRAFAGRGRTELQKSIPFDDAGAITLIPDFIQYANDGAPIAVADAKYKVTDKKDPGAVYQMLAYCTALGLKDGHLVYAKGLAPHTAYWLPTAGITLHQHALDLDQPPARLLAEIQGLAAAMAPTPSPVGS